MTVGEKAFGIFDPGACIGPGNNDYGRDPFYLEQRRQEEVVALRAENAILQTEILKLKSDRRDGYIKAALTGLCANPNIQASCKEKAEGAILHANAVMELLGKEKSNG